MRTAIQTAGGIALAFLASIASAVAADPVFPAGSSIGLVPPPGMTTPGTGFTGFEDRATGASIVIVEMPAEAYPQLVEKFTPAALKPSGVEATGPATDLPAPGVADAKLIRGTQSASGLNFRKWIVVAQGETGTAMVTVQAPDTTRDRLPDTAIETALQTIAFRPPVPIDDQIAALPFHIGDRAGFRPVRAIAGSSVYFTDGPKDIVADQSQPVVIVAASMTGSIAPAPEQRQAFARKAMAGLNGVSDIRIETDTIKPKGQGSVSRIAAKAKDARTGNPTSVVQTMYFDGDRYIRTIAMTRQADAAKYAARFDAMADSVMPK